MACGHFDVARQHLGFTGYNILHVVHTRRSHTGGLYAVYLVVTGGATGGGGRYTNSAGRGSDGERGGGAWCALRWLCSTYWACSSMTAHHDSEEVVRSYEKVEPHHVERGEPVEPDAIVSCKQLV